MKLTIELIPKSMFYSNVRSNMSKDEWDVLRRATYQKAGYVCEICGGKGPDHPVECHEIWEFIIISGRGDKEPNIQRLVRLIALCPLCHQVKHIGLAQMRGNLDICMTHLKKVNEWNEEQASEYVAKCFAVWRMRSKLKWKLDLSVLKKGA